MSNLMYNAPNGNWWNFVAIAKWIKEGCDPKAKNAIAANELLLMQEQGWIEVAGATGQKTTKFSVKFTAIGRYEYARQKVAIPRMEKERKAAEKAAAEAQAAASAGSGNPDVQTLPDGRVVVNGQIYSPAG